MNYIASIDQGTTSTRCIFFDKKGKIISVAQKEHEQIFPQPGWVEHNPEEIWRNTQEVIANARIKHQIKIENILACGITNQRETTVVWNRRTGKAYYNALVWQDGSMMPTLVADQGQVYSLEISNECGLVRDELNLQYDTRVPVVELGSPVEWCEGDEFSFNATQPFNAIYQWSTGAPSGSINVDQPGLYSVSITTPCATASDDVEVVPGNDCIVHEGIYVPNVFSPNGDQVNDVFTVFFGSDIEVTSSVGTIYDRWGNLVLQSDSIPFVWDGQFGGENVQPGVFVYVINVSYTNGVLVRDEVFYGDVTVIR